MSTNNICVECAKLPRVTNPSCECLRHPSKWAGRPFPKTLKAKAVKIVVEQTYTPSSADVAELALERLYAPVGSIERSNLTEDKAFLQNLVERFNANYVRLNGTTWHDNR